MNPATFLKGWRARMRSSVNGAVGETQRKGWRSRRGTGPLRRLPTCPSSTRLPAERGLGFPKCSRCWEAGNVSPLLPGIRIRGAWRTLWDPPCGGEAALPRRRICEARDGPPSRGRGACRRACSRRRRRRAAARLCWRVCAAGRPEPRGNPAEPRRVFGSHSPTESCRFTFSIPGPARSG